MTLTDENAFGLLIAFHDLEDAEYGSEPEEFVTRMTEFRGLTLDAAVATPLGAGAIAIELGHAVYFEVGDGDQAVDLITWLRNVAAPLVERGFEITAVLTHGGRWVESETGAMPEVQALEGGYRLVRLSLPSEPLRRALYAETATHGVEGGDGWGGGLYVDTDAVEALGRVLKNAPTPLASAGATFFRMKL